MCGGMLPRVTGRGGGGGRGVGAGGAVWVGAPACSAGRPAADTRVRRLLQGVSPRVAATQVLALFDSSGKGRAFRTLTNPDLSVLFGGKRRFCTFYDTGHGLPVPVFFR